MELNRTRNNPKRATNERAEGNGGTARLWGAEGQYPAALHDEGYAAWNCDKDGLIGLKEDHSLRRIE